MILTSRVLIPALLSLAIFALAACEGSSPPCAFLELQGDTIGGAVLLDDPLDSGERANRAIAVAVTGVPNIPEEDYRARYVVDCDDDGCAVDIDCTPDIIDAGQAMFCDVYDVTEEGTASCNWSCGIAFEVGHGDTSLCEPARVTYDVAGRHEPEE
jgi:hypothetical protein